MPLAKLSSKSQIVLPAAIRRSLGLQAGDWLEVAQEGDHVVLRKAPGSFVEALDACGSDLWAGYEGELEEARGEWDR
ncbi:MAG: AbrB/MazE/SpoVT family DNA-binding domain-containing protein [Deltaproteobacteria bacterium]|nr:AbrB/MazE/SpoVT family DNA-binding domain-containing protein [Deltaproteobacteria bacterium]